MAIEEAFIMQRARQLYWQGYPPAEIARLMGINQNTIYSWKKRDEWDTTPPIQRVTTSIDARLIQLTSKDTKTGGDFKEIDLLTRQLKKLDNGTPVTQPKKKIRKKQNFFSEAQISALRANIIDSLHWHQKTILAKGRCFYHHSVEKLSRAAFTAGGMSVVDGGFHIAVQHHFFLLGQLIVQTEKMTCLMVRFHSYSLIHFCFKDKPGETGRNITLTAAR